MSVTISTTNKPLNPRAQDLSPKGYNRASLYSGKALDFDGVNDQVNVTTSDLDFGANDFSVTMVADWDGAYKDGKMAYAEKGSSGSQLATFQIRMENNGSILFQTNTSAGWQYVEYSSVGEILSNALTHLTFVRVGTGVSLYINGQFYSNGSGIIAATLDTHNGDFAIGNRIGANNYYSGKIGQYKIFSGALTAAQVSDLYLNPEKIVPDGVANSALKLWLPMMEGAGTTAYDGSGNGNDGTINGATWVSGVGAPVAQTALVGWNKGVNLALYSEQFDNAAWTKVSTTITANAIVGPNGYQTADKAEAFSSSQLISQFPSITAGQPFVFSVFAKAGNWGIIRIGNQASSTNGSWFNLNTGTAGTINGGTNEIIDYGNGWYLLVAKFSSFVSGQVFIGISDADGSTTTPAVGSNLYLWGAQVTQTSTLQPYIPTLATAQTSPVLLPQGLTANKDITGVNSVSRNAYALNLDGASWAEVHDNASLDITGYITLEAWVEIKDGMVADGILGRWTSSLGYLLYLNSSTDVRFYVEGLDVRYTSLTNGWHHIVGVYDGTKKRIYVDGVERNLSNQTTGASASNNPIEIGRYQQSTGNAFDNQIALPRIYNRALTATEVARNYNADKSKFGL